MAAYTAGQKFCRGYQTEITYGVMQASTLLWAGELIKFKPMLSPKREYHIYPSSRAFSAATSGPLEEGFTAEFHSRAAAEWKAFYAYYGMGASTTTADALPAGFTMLFDIYDGTTHRYKTYNGCKINKLEIEGTGVGQALIFRIEVFAQHHDETSTKVLNTVQSVTIGGDSTTPGGATLIWTANHTINIAAGGAVAIYPEKFKFTLHNHLTRQNGIVTGSDTLLYPVAVAQDEGIRDITYEAELIAQNTTYEAAKTLNSLVTALTIPIDDETITLSNGYFTGDDHPEYSQDVNREPIKINFKTLAIA